MTLLRRSRALLSAAACTAALAGALACGPRKPAPGPAVPAGEEGVVQSESDGTVVDGVYRDLSAGLELAVPAGWRANPRFRAGRSGPPPAGSLRVRLEDGSGCMIDVAVEPAPAGVPTGETFRRDRELFFFSAIEEPAPQLAFESIWTATFVPADPSKLDVGYWIRRALAGDAAMVRVEGRFPLASVTRCKTALDDVVRSLRAKDVDRVAGDQSSMSVTRAINP